jgi:hypothetical protein
MEPNPARRFESARDFARALAEAVEMPFSKTGTVILERYAPELMKGSSHSLTVGRPVPPEMPTGPDAVVTAPGRPAANMVTESDGVPRLPGTAPDEQPRPLSTIATSSGQVSAPVASASPGSRSRRGIVVVGGVIAVLAVVAIAAVAMSGGSKAEKPASAPSIAVDAGITTAPRTDDAQAAARSAVAVVTTPDGAEVFINGKSQGLAPVNVQLAVGEEVTVHAELLGHVAASETLRVAATPATVRLELVPVAVDAGPEPAVTGQQPEPEPKSGGSRGGKGKGDKGADKGGKGGDKVGKGADKGTGAKAGTGAGSQSGSAFDPNDVL